MPVDPSRLTALALSGPLAPKVAPSSGNASLPALDASAATSVPALALASVAEVGAVVPTVANVVATDAEELLESSVLGQTLPAQLALLLVNGVLVPSVEVHVLPPDGVVVNTIDAAVEWPLCMIVAVNAANVGVVTSTTATAAPNSIARRTWRPRGQRLITVHDEQEQRSHGRAGHTPGAPPDTRSEPRI
jgi:hypothetical protein